MQHFITLAAPGTRVRQIAGPGPGQRRPKVAANISRNLGADYGWVTRIWPEAWGSLRELLVLERRGDRDL